MDFLLKLPMIILQLNHLIMFQLNGKYNLLLHLHKSVLLQQIPYINKNININKYIYIYI